jgi:hypothetical protein
MTEPKPLNFNPEPGVGFTAERRPDGGMNLVFKDIDSNTLGHWRSFAEEHLLGSDRLVRNLYDLRQVDHLSERAIRIAVELNSDPSTRNIRLAVVVSDPALQESIRKISDLTPAGGVRMQVFTDLAEAEAWLNRPMESMV